MKQQRQSISNTARKAKTQDKNLRKLLNAPTVDSFQNFAAKLGIGTDNLTSGSTYGFNPITRVRPLLEWIHRGSWIGGIAVDVVADDMTRAGVTIKGELKPEEIQKINERVTTLAIWDQINEVIKWGRLYGGALGVFLIDGQDTATPIRLETVKKDQFKGLQVLDRWMVEPSLNNLVTEFGPNLGQPKFYTVTSDAFGLRGKKIHYSRCLRSTGIKVPYWQRVMENLWGISVFERLYDRMVAFDSATTGAAQLVYKSYIRTYKIDGLRELISNGGPALQGLMNMIDMMRRFQSIEGITLLDKEDEFEATSNNSFAGISDALLQFGQQLAGALQIPLVRLFGQSPAGLNATGESDLRMYYDGIRQQQETMIVPITRIYRCVAQSLGFTVPDGFGLAFNPLWQLTEKEKAETAGQITETVVKANEAGLVSQQTAMRELKQSSEITGVWTNITDEDIESAEEELPPSPQELAEQQMEQGGEEGEEGGAPITSDSTSSHEPVICEQVSGNNVQKIFKCPKCGQQGKYLVNRMKNNPYADVICVGDGQLHLQKFVRGTNDSKSTSGMQYFHDLQPVIENPKGSIRKGKNWEVVMAADYGYLRGYTGADGDQLDCFVGSNPESDKVHIINQRKVHSADFDEHKVMLGYWTPESAKEDFVNSYNSHGHDRIMEMHSLSMKDFKQWLKDGDLTKPFAPAISGEI
jgi:phage-related protein (TIGR01555 family)